MKERNYSIELYRCYCMFGIVVLHCAMIFLGTFTWPVNICKFCVDGFAFISGYYGIRAFKAKKIFHLYFVTLCCILLAELAMSNGHVFSVSLGRVHQCVMKLWFLHAYVILMMLAPFINLAVENKTHRKILLPFCTIILVWGTLSELPIIGKLIIRTNGIGSFSGLTLAAVYAIGRLYSTSNFQQRVKFWWVISAVPVLGFINCFGLPHSRTGEWVSGWFGNYASPFSVLLAICVFYLFSRITISRRIGKIISFVAISMFPVYVLHQHPFFWDWLLEKAKLAKESGYGMMEMLSISLMVFAGCILFDLIRRFLVFLFEKGAAFGWNLFKLR